MTISDSNRVIRRPGLYALMNGTQWPVLIAGQDVVVVDGPAGRQEVRRDELDDLLKVSTHARWRGGEVILRGPSRDGVAAGFYTWDRALAVSQSLDGEQNSGWSGEASVAELSDVREEVVSTSGDSRDRTPETSRPRPEVRAQRLPDLDGINRKHAAELTMFRLNLGASLVAAGVAADSVVLADKHAHASAPTPEGKWTIVPVGVKWRVGALARGEFSTYEFLSDQQEAIDLAVRLASTRLEWRTREVSDREARRGFAVAGRIRAATRERGGEMGPTVLAPGDLVDMIGLETSHHLYALGTPVPERAQPPRELEDPYFCFEVRRALPEGVRDGLVAPWFGQTGGGAVVALERPVRWYVDNGYLDVVT